jgi:transposase InsO family protein
VLENLALRQQLGVLRRSVKRPRIEDRDRLLWLLLHRFYTAWDKALAIVSPDTVLHWHREGWRKYWGWRCQRRRRLGRPPIGWDLVVIIRLLAKQNRTWGARRIHDELVPLGHSVGVQTVRRYMPKRRRPGTGQRWKTFLQNELRATAACDFFSVPTATFRNLFVLVVLAHHRRHIQHVAVTAHPTSAWTAAQLEAAFPKGDRPKFLIHDRHKMFRSRTFLTALAHMRITDMPTAPRQCWQNGLCERVIETLRHDCTDHVLALGEQHLEGLLREYVNWYNASRTHFSLGGNAPQPRTREPTPVRRLSVTPVLGGLHHAYRVAAA